jgi:hypothetical protein
MKIAKFVAFIGLAAMTAALIYGFGWGDFGRDGTALLQNPWGVVSIVDLYTGFVLFSGWVIYREKSIALAVLWTLSIMALGSLAASVYTLVALYASRGEWPRFWMGKNARS